MVWYCNISENIHLSRHLPAMRPDATVLFDGK